MQPTAWLNLDSFSRRISLPTNFNVEVFRPFLLDLEEIELSNLLGTAKLAELAAWLLLHPYGVVSESDLSGLSAASLKLKTLYELVEPFLVYAAYAEFVLKGSVQATDTGLVEKSRDSSLSLTDTQRTQLYRDYRDKAESRAARIRALVDADRAECQSLLYTAGARISSSRGKTKSVFD